MVLITDSPYLNNNFSQSNIKFTYIVCVSNTLYSRFFAFLAMFTFLWFPSALTEISISVNRKRPLKALYFKT